MSAVTGRGPAKADRVLAAAAELVLSRGVRSVTISEIAQQARVGKGTVYLYWDSRQDLLVEVFARDNIAVLDEITARLQADAETIRPRWLCPLLIRTALAHPYVRATQVRDPDTVNLFADPPAAKDLLVSLRPGALLYDLLPTMRRFGVARSDVSLDDQVYAAQALMIGFVQLATTADLSSRLTPFGDEEVTSAAARQLLEPGGEGVGDVVAARGEALSVLDVSRAALATSLSRCRKTPAE